MSPIVATPLVTGFVAIYIEFSAWPRIDRDSGCWMLDLGCWLMRCARRSLESRQVQ